MRSQVLELPVAGLERIKIEIPVLKRGDWAGVMLSAAGGVPDDLQARFITRDGRELSLLTEPQANGDLLLVGTGAQRARQPWIEIDDPRFELLQVSRSFDGVDQRHLLHRSSIALTDLWGPPDMQLRGRSIETGKLLWRPLRRNEDGSRGEAHDWPPGKWLLQLDNGRSEPLPYLVEVKAGTACEVSWEKARASRVRLSGHLTAQGDAIDHVAGMWFVEASLAEELGLSAGIQLDGLAKSLSRIRQQADLGHHHARGHWEGGRYSATLGTPGEWICITALPGNFLALLPFEIPKTPAPGEVGSNGRWIQRDFELKDVAALHVTLLLPVGLDSSRVRLSVNGHKTSIASDPAGDPAQVRFEGPLLAPGEYELLVDYALSPAARSFDHRVLARERILVALAEPVELDLRTGCAACLIADWTEVDEPWSPYLVADRETLLTLVASSTPAKVLFDSPLVASTLADRPLVLPSLPPGSYRPWLFSYSRGWAWQAPEPLVLGAGEEHCWVPEPRLVTRDVQVSHAGLPMGDVELKWSDGVLDLPRAHAELDAEGRATLTLPAGRYEFQVGERGRALQFLPAAGGGVLRIELGE